MKRREIEQKVLSACDVLRRDDNTKLVTKYIEHISWLLFLKVYDDLEDERELIDPRYRRIIDGEYRWSVWATKDWAADELVAFVTDDLMPHLRALSGTREATLIASLFGGITTVVKSGFNLKDVLEKIDAIDFHSVDDVHTVSVVYESLLALIGEAGAAGEHYTPRPIVRLMVRVLAPRLGETVYDPGCGSAGFLVEAYEHLVGSERTIGDRERLQCSTFFGQESGELPYALGVMNMILHGVTRPNIIRANTLEKDIRSIPPSARHDVILTNPPFGGKENRQVQQNFPIRSSATEILFLQHIVASLKPSGRCAVVVPDGVLFDDDAAFRQTRRMLLDECNLHTVVRLPAGSFLYTPHQRLNLLFFERQGPTKEIWFYEHPVPESRRHLKHPRYTKTQPLRYEEFEPLLAWWHERAENDHAWRVPVSELDAATLGLDLHHPDRAPTEATPTPEAVRDEVLQAVDALRAYADELVAAREAFASITATGLPVATVAAAGIKVNPESRDPSRGPDGVFTYVDLSSVDRGAITAGASIPAAKAPSRARRVLRGGDVLFATVRPYLRGHAVVPDELDGAIASTGFAVLRPPPHVDPGYLLVALLSSAVVGQCLEMMRGAHYPALKVDQVKALRVPLPDTLTEQREIVRAVWPQIVALRNARLGISEQVRDLLDSLKDSEFGLLMR